MILVQNIWILDCISRPANNTLNKYKCHYDPEIGTQGLEPNLIEHNLHWS